MENFKIGDIVARKSYNYDILFKITKINSNGMIDLAGLSVRIVADAPDYDLKHINKDEVEKRLKNIEKSRYQRISRCYINTYNRNNSRKFNNYCRYNNYYIYNKKYNNQKIYGNVYNIRDEVNIDEINVYKKESVLKRPGTVLHLDGDSEYAQKCKDSYKKMGMTAYIYTIPESEQYKQVYTLLQKIRPNILILTGHDAFLKKRNDIYNIENYKNSRYFIKGVLEARRYEHNLDNLVIFAGACQSYYEAIISAGANFASAPKRVLIDMMDPLIVAETIAYTPVDEFVSISNIISNTREGISGVGGIQTRGTFRTGMPGL